MVYPTLIVAVFSIEILSWGIADKSPLSNVLKYGLERPFGTSASKAIEKASTANCFYTYFNNTI